MASSPPALIPRPPPSSAREHNRTLEPESRDDPRARARAHSDTSTHPRTHPAGLVPSPSASGGGLLTASLGSPHDAVLADLHGSRDFSASHPHPHPHPARSAPKLSVVSSVGTLERTASPSAGAPSTTSTPATATTTAQELLYDPFSGNPAGLMAPTPSSSRRETTTTTTERDAHEFDHRRDELWARLTNIRELQSEVASMHVQMEGIGLSDVRGTKRAPGGVGGRVHSDTIPVGGAEEWDEPAETGAAEAVEEQRKRARDAEFTNLAETFKGRREAIDAIMNKLGELSDALTTFHALPTPVMDVAVSRNNTKDSMPISPDMVNLTSPSTAASPSPELPPVLPKFVLSEPDKGGVMHDSPISAPGEFHPSPA